VIYLFYVPYKSISTSGLNSGPDSIMGAGIENGSHQRALNSVGGFSSPIEAPATPRRPLREGRELGTPVPRGTMVFAGGGVLSARGCDGSHLKRRGKVGRRR
jgi:hypothetical protein